MRLDSLHDRRVVSSSIATSTHHVVHGLLGTLGLLGCDPGTDVVPPSDGDATPRVPTGEAEPSARVTSSSSEPTSATASIPESREWCGAIIDTRPRPLLRTSSFLLAWNEVRVADGRAPAGPIPLNEHDARLTICGAPTCQVVEAKPIEFNDAGRISIGTVIPAGSESMLVIPDLSPFFSSQHCASATQMSSQRIGDVVQVSAVVEQVNYHGHGHHGYYRNYGGCYAQAGRHDVFVDVATGMIELEIEHRGVVLDVSASDEGGLHVTLSGCNETLELAWTE